MRFRLSSKLLQLQSHIFGDKTNLSASVRCGVCFCTTYAVQLLEGGWNEVRNTMYDEPLKNPQSWGVPCVDRLQVAFCSV